MISMNCKIIKHTILLIFLFVVLACQGQMKNKEQEPTKRIDRQPAVAGTFYPADSVALQASLKEAFSKAEPRKATGNVLAIISPHAGYIYSSKVAASAFNQIDTSRHYKHIFVIGSSHRAQFEGASIYTVGNYVTPLGDIKTDALAQELTNSNPVFTNNINPHLEEHTIEVQLPFLQFLIKERLSIVPIVLGTQSPEVCKQIALALKPYFTEENLFVISTDFTHYPSYEIAKNVDAFMADAVISNSPDKLISAVNDIDKRKDPNLLTGMCGWTSVLTLLNISSAIPGITIKKVDYQNSGDTRHGDKSRVVGYTALEFEVQPKHTTQPIFDLTGDEKQTLLNIARSSIKAYVLHMEKPVINASNLTPVLKCMCGAFVSLHINDELRGCIGTFREDKVLYQNVREMAIAAATSDYRFDPVSVGELNSITIEISVLSPMHKISSTDEIILGKHGIYIKKDGKTGTLLPQVAKDRNMTKEEFLGFCSRDKAGIGWHGWKNAEIYTYEALVFSESKK
jgi:AmmeMemoRadiSam system protein B/AmmeMemoRadiSam system protein A